MHTSGTLLLYCCITFVYCHLAVSIVLPMATTQVGLLNHLNHLNDSQKQVEVMSRYTPPPSIH